METRFFPLLFTLYRQTFVIFFKRFWSFLFFALISSFVYVLALSLYWSYYHSWNLMNVVQDPAVGFVVVVGFFLVHTFLKLGLLYTIANKRTSVMDSLGRAFIRWIPFFFLQVVLFFLIVGHLGLLILPGIILAIYFSLSMYPFVEEKKGILESIRFSTYLVAKNVWFVLFSSVVTAILLSLLGYVPYLNLILFLFAPILICILGFVLYAHLKAVKIHISVPEVGFGWRTIFSLLGFACLGMALLYWLQ